MPNPTLVTCYVCDTTYSFLTYVDCPICEHRKEVAKAMESIRGFRVDFPKEEEYDWESVEVETPKTVMDKIRSVVNLRSIFEVV